MQGTAVQNQRAKDFFLTLPFLALFFIQLAHHALWRDELNVVGIVNASPTFRSLINHVHYEGHPWLWYFILWLISKTISTSVLSLKLVQAIIGAGILLMIGVFSPFSRLEKVLLLLSYFFTFEYTVMARMYGLMVLIMMFYLRDRVRHPNTVAWKIVFLGLLTNIDLMGWILCAGLGAELLLFWFRTEKPASRPPLRAILLGFSAFVPIAAFGFWTLYPLKDVSVRTTGHVAQHASDLFILKEVIVWYLLQPFFPVRRGWSAPFWSIRMQPTVFAVIGCVLVLCIYWLIFRKHSRLLINVLLAVFLGIGFGQLIYLGAIRHNGVTFLAFIASLWILRSQSHRRLPALALLLVGLTSIGGIAMNILEWRRPFSNAANTAHWLQQQHLENAPIAGTPDTSVLDIAAYLHRPVYFLECRCSDTFVLYSTRRDNFTAADIPVRLAESRAALNASTSLFLVTSPLTPQQTAQIAALGMQSTLLKSFTGAEAAQENYFIYQVTSDNSVQNFALLNQRPLPY